MARVGAPVAQRIDAPLIVALHGGTDTSAYFDLPGFSLLDRAAAAGCRSSRSTGPAMARRRRCRPGSHDADAPVPRAELIDIVAGWPTVAADVLGRVRVPVHYRLAEHDRLWVTSEAEVARLAAMLTQAPAVDAAILPGAGHCIDFHRRGGAFQVEQIEFARRCGLGLIRSRG